MDTILDCIMNYTILGNSILRIIISVGVIVIGIIAITGVKRYVARKSAGLAEGNGKTILQKLFQIHSYAAPLICIVIVYTSLVSVLTLSPQIQKILYTAFIVTASFFGLRLCSLLIKNSLKTYLRSRDSEKSDDQIELSIRGISTFINIFLWAVGAIFIIDNIGFNISAIVTGLGIGGVAVALASQTIFRDLFNYFVIFFDQPFKIGDFIIVDDKMGTIEKIGIKTTRIQSLSGEQIILSNTDLTDARVHNYKRMAKRRVVLTIGVVYHTTPEQVDAIPGIIREIIEGTEGVAFDRAHFKEFGDSGLVFEAVYYVESPDYNYYMDRQHDINLQILKRFNELNIGFAYPTRTLYLEQKQ